MTIKRLRHMLVLLVTGAALVLAACGGGGAGNGSGTGASNGNGGATASEPAGGNGGGTGLADELKIGWAEGSSLDPAMASLIQDFAIIKQIYSGLVQYKMGTTEIVPDLAESWDISDDGLTYTFHLRPGVKWQKGYGDLTAQQVVDSFKRVMDPATASPFLSTLADVKDVSAPDDQTVVFTLKQPSAFFLDQIVAFREGFIVNTKAVADEGEDYARNPVGTGPYQLVKWVPGQYIELEANPDYYAGAPKTKNVRFVNIPDSSARQIALESGQIDVYWNASDAELVKAFQDNPDFTVSSQPHTGYQGITMKLQDKPFSDVRVRQAMAYAIDYKALTEGIRGGLATKMTSFIPAGMFGHTDDVPQYTYNPDKAKALLKAAGYPNGFKTSINVLNSSFYPDVFQVIRSNFKDVGIDLTVNLVDAATWSKTLRTGDSPMSILLTTRAEPDQILSQFFNSAVCPPKGMDYGCYAGVDDLMAKGRITMDDNARKQIYVQIQQKMQADLPQIPLFQNDGVTIYSNRVHNYVPGLFFGADLTKVTVDKAQ